MVKQIFSTLVVACTVAFMPIGLAAQTDAIVINATSPEPGRIGPETGYPLPRFVSLDTGEANARRGPSRSQRIDWVYTRRGMPLIIIAEHGHWRRVIDQEGEGGWMHYSLLTGVRTAIVETDMVELRTRPDPDANVRAQAELGVIGRLQECRENWCLLAADGYRGWVPQNTLWGTAPGELID